MFFFFEKKNKVDPSDQRLPILTKVSLKHISCVEFHGGSNGTIKIQLEFWNPPVIRDNSWQIKIFEKFWKNVFYAEFYGESNGTTHFVLRHRNPPQNPIFRSLDSFCIIFRYFLHCWVGFFKYVVIMKSVVKFQCDLCLKSSFYSFSAWCYVDSKNLTEFLTALPRVHQHHDLIAVLSKMVSTIVFFSKCEFKLMIFIFCPKWYFYSYQL